jgi:hypothetical protein
MPVITVYDWFSQKHLRLLLALGRNNPDLSLDRSQVGRLLKGDMFISAADKDHLCSIQRQ